jgi:hypothetical protein
MINQYLGTPAYWKTRRFRFHCPQCKTEGWHGIAGDIPQHDRPDGRNCHVALRGGGFRPNEGEISGTIETIKGGYLR